MSNAMLSVRMPAAKKETGNALLKQLGSSASQAVNDLYDYVLENRALPFPQSAQQRTHTREEIKRAVELIDGISTLPANNRFSTMTDDEIRAERLRARGLLD